MPDLLRHVSRRFRQRYKVWLITAAVIFYTLPVVFFRGFSHGAAYIKFDGVDGESTDKSHKDWIDVLTYKFNISRQDGEVIPKLEVGGTGMSKPIDKSSPILMVQCAGDAKATMGSIEYTKDIQGVQRTYLKIEMSNVQVTNYDFGGSSTTVGKDLVPVDAVSLNFEDITMTYIPFDPSTGEPMTPVVGKCKFGTAPAPQ